VNLPYMMISKKSSPLKPLCQMNRNWVGSIYGRFSIKIGHFVPIHVAMFVNGSGQNEQSLQRTFHRSFLPSFGSFGNTVSEEKNLKNQPIRNKNRLWRPCLLTDKSSPLKPLCQMNRNLVGCIYGRSSIKIAHFVPIH
jgi:hypothetical protein